MTDLSLLGWTPDRAAELPPGCLPARVTRVDRGRLTVLGSEGDARVRPARRCTTTPSWAARRWGTGWRCGVSSRSPSCPGPARSPARSPAARRPPGGGGQPGHRAGGRFPGETRLRRLERYLAVAWGSGATPVVVLTKAADLCDDVAEAGAEVAEDALGIEVVPVSGRTAATVGPSGVGKSSLANALAGETLAVTREIRESDGRGRHTTTARELHLLPGGGMLVDTPGMRELGLYDDAEGVDTAYADVAALAAGCRFRDCGHRSEPGCAVGAALDDGRLDPARYSAWRKLQAEAHRQLLRVDARARAQERARLRTFHRALREQPNRPR